MAGMMSKGESIPSSLGRGTNWSGRYRSTDSPVVLAASGLKKVYGKRTVVQGVSFEVHEGEVVGLLGPNGAGKTTSFRMTCGLISANAGKVYLSGKDVSEWPMSKRARDGKMGYLPQDRSVFGSLSTEKNLYMAMELLGFSRTAQKKRCEELLRKFNLLHVRKTIVGAGGTGGLSGGERRRLEIARALLSEPRILLLDEPFANVDPNTVTEIQQVVRELSAEGIAILITDHQIDATMEIANYCYVIYSGQVLCSGNPIDVLSHPEARKLYFGEKSQQQLENLVKKISASGADLSGRSRPAPMGGKMSAGESPRGGIGSFGSRSNREPFRSSEQTGYVVEDDDEEDGSDYRSGASRRDSERGGKRSFPDRPDRERGSRVKGRSRPVDKTRSIDEYLDDEEILPPNRENRPRR